MEVVRQWIREGRANAQSRVRAEGGADWQPLQAFPELAALLAAGPPPLAPPPFSPAVESAIPAGKTNGMALTGFVFSLLGIPCCACCCGIFPFFGLIFSAIGLIQTLREPRQRGRELAVAGIVISVLMIIFTAVAVVLSAIFLDKN